MFSSETWLAKTDSSFYNGATSKSARFRQPDSSYLVKTFSSDGDLQQQTISFWLKRGQATIGSYNIGEIITQGFSGAGSSQSSARITLESDKLNISQEDNNSTTWERISNNLFRDSTNWYHFVIAFDVSESSYSDRVKAWVNGVAITWATETSNKPDQNTDMRFGKANQRIGVSDASGNPWSATYFDGYLAQFECTDGVVNAPTAFGELKEGCWIPKEYVGSYGTNGFKLEFKQTGTGGASTSTIGADTSGNTNHWTDTNFASHDSNLLDHPENNFATGIGALSPNVDSQSYYQSVWSEGNLKFVATASWNNGQSNFGFRSGKWYAEHRVNALYSGSHYFRFGMKASPDRTYDEIFWIENGNGQVDATSSPYSDRVGTYTTGDILMVAVDLDSSTRAIWFGKNGTWENSATESEIEAGTTTNAFVASNTIIPINDGYTYFLYAQGHGGTTSGTWNFGQDSTFAGTETAGGYQDANNIGDFKYSVPDGFLAQCSQNRSEPSLGPNSDELPNQHYQNYLFTGDSNSTRTISGLNFQPDLLWSKARNQTFSHRIYDSTRGADKGFILASGATLYAIESTHDVFDGFTSDGYRTTTDGSAGDLLNYNTGTYINWLWKANAGTTTTNDASATSVGDIDSVYQANTTAGFSIVQYTGTGSAGGIAHGLGAVPHFILIKNRTHNSGNGSGTNWVVYHRHMDSSEPQDYSLYISTAGRGDYVGMFNDTAPTSTTFTVGTHMTVNSGDPNYYMAYVWTEIKNFSKFGLYEGTGNIDGPYVFTGFRPALLVVKNRDTTGWWAVSDSGRSTFNEVANTLAWDQGYTESALTSDLKVDFLSNGFKIRDTDGYYNTDGAEYIYAAWAEMPAKYANAF
jgi:hypothetical protein